MKKLPIFKCRCSAIGQIMTNDRSGKAMGETAKSFLKDWIREQIYGFQKEIKSKYLEKGTLLEDEAIRFYIKEKGIDFLLKNDERFEDEFFTGEPDVIEEEVVYDFKNSWDAYTFPLFDEEPDKDYHGQLQGYMHLTGVKRAKLVHVLLPTPPEIYFATHRDYSGIDSKFRIKEFDIEYNPEFIEKAKARVLEAREYIAEVAKSILT